MMIGSGISKASLTSEANIGLKEEISGFIDIQCLPFGYRGT
ncbi:hypothetical protein BGS_1390 [Beggiatoa sp. SS]|nr:hypothetical protein BGS_1390 [Beggiatoa sp. SS]